MVAEFLTGLLHDLERRCLLLGERCASASDETDVRDHALRAYRTVEESRRQVQRLLGDPSLGAAVLLPNQFQTYRRLAEEVTQTEAFVLPFVERYGETDRRLTRLCRQLATQIRWPLPAPLIGAFSSQYYWTIASFNVISVPAGETSTLLGLPDLCHEMGHLLLAAYEMQFFTDFLNELMDYIHHEKRRIDSEGRAPEYKLLYDTLSVAWASRWALEILSDMIATYLVGTAFGWQHLRLCASQAGATAYSPVLGDAAAYNHPANEARMRGVLAVLELMGTSDASAQLDDVWDRYVAVSGERRPP